VNVNIAAQAVGNLNVNIAASAVTLNVAIQSSAVTLNVAIQSSAVTLNVAIQSAVQLNINIAAQAVDVNVLAPSGKMVSMGQTVSAGTVSAATSLSGGQEVELFSATGRGRLIGVSFYLYGVSTSDNVLPTKLKILVDGAVKYNQYVSELDTRGNGYNLLSQLAAAGTKYRPTVVNPLMSLTYVKTSSAWSTFQCEQVGGFFNVPMEYTTSLSVRLVPDSTVSGYAIVQVTYGGYV
jgi:hypothetical protein